VSPLLALRNLSSAAEPELAGWLSLSECRTLSRDGPESLFSPVPLVVVAIVLLEWSTALLSAGRLGGCSALVVISGWLGRRASRGDDDQQSGKRMRNHHDASVLSLLASNAVGAIMHCSIT
jgi:hypothetical protein